MATHRMHLQGPLERSQRGATELKVHQVANLCQANGQSMLTSSCSGGDSAVPDVPTTIRTSAFRFRRVPGLDPGASGRARERDRKRRRVSASCLRFRADKLVQICGESLASVSMKGTASSCPLASLAGRAETGWGGGGGCYPEGHLRGHWICFICWKST